MYFKTLVKVIILYSYVCRGPWEGSVRGPCEWGRHFGERGNQPQRREQRASVEPGQEKG
jgi:hypothetical protein